MWSFYLYGLDAQQAHQALVQTQDAASAACACNADAKKEKSAKKEVLGLLHEAHQELLALPDESRQKFLEKEFLPKTRERSYYVETYKMLASELTIDHDDFFADYASKLLKVILINWSLRNGNYGSLSMNGDGVNQSLVDELQEELELKSDDFIKVKSYSSETMHKLFLEEIKDVKTKKCATYEWFVLFSTRMSYLVAPDELFWDTVSRIGKQQALFFHFNTGLTQYAFLIRYLGVWRSQDHFRKFLEKVGNHPTREFHSPLALSKLFPQIIMMPYPFGINIREILDFYPGEEHNIYPIGFSFKNIDADGADMLPETFFMHDMQHLAVYRYMFSAIGANALDDSNIQFVGQWLQKGKSFFDKAINMLIRESNDIKDETLKKLVEFYLYKISHEGANGLWFRVRQLLGDQELSVTSYDPQSMKAFLNAEDLKKKNGVDLNNLKQGDETLVKAYLKEYASPQFNTFVKEQLDKTLLQVLRDGCIGKVEGLMRKSDQTLSLHSMPFWPYTFHLRQKNLMSAVHKKELLPLDYKGIYYFFPDIYCGETERYWQGTNDNELTTMSEKNIKKEAKQVEDSALTETNAIGAVQQ